ncbi:hypothetical protein F4811DRAFT_24440 [Daldinia bambusicola]|nr:hypothetical protein F4811DRAFT_24440 [Daldinia bambusicola]
MLIVRTPTKPDKSGYPCGRVRIYLETTQGKGGVTIHAEKLAYTAVSERQVYLGMGGKKEERGKVWFWEAGPVVVLLLAKQQKASNQNFSMMYGSYFSCVVLVDCVSGLTGKKKRERKRERECVCVWLQIRYIFLFCFYLYYFLPLRLAALFVSSKEEMEIREMMTTTTTAAATAAAARTIGRRTMMTAGLAL